MQKYNKLWVALAGAVVSAVVAYFGKDTHLAQTVVAVLTALGVYQVPNSEI